MGKYRRVFALFSVIVVASLGVIVGTAVPASAATTCGGSATAFGGGPGVAYSTIAPSVTQNSPHFNCVLVRNNNNNWGVIVLQIALRDCAGQAIAVDGDFGAGTEQAVKNVQAVTGVGVDGKYGPVTRNAMPWPASSTTGSGCVVGNLFNFPN